ncbi:MAG TPA: hypothetical protein VGP84_03515 [Gemmatimonadaceae bacterium]|nr:hypothetical protein [Gemmatimonadaceae bacterium]
MRPGAIPFLAGYAVLRGGLAFALVFFLLVLVFMLVLAAWDASRHPNKEFRQAELPFSRMST